MSENASPRSHTPVPVRWVTTTSGIPGAPPTSDRLPPPPPLRPATRPWWRLAPATASLIVLNTLVYLTEIVAGGADNSAVLLRLGAGARSLVLGGDWWRLMSCTVLHAGPLHLAANMFSLWSVGRVTERLIGTPRFLAVYCISGLAASGLGILASDNTLVGASGAIIGLLGPVIVFTVRMSRGSVGQRLAQLARQWAPTALMLALPGLLIPQVSNAAHAGGLLGGVVVGMMVGVRPPPGVPSRGRLRLLVGVASALMASGIGAGLWHAWSPAAGRVSVVLSGVRIAAPAESRFYPLDRETAVWNSAFVSVQSRRWDAAAPGGRPRVISRTEAAAWMREVLSTDFGGRVALPAVDLVWLPGSLSLPAAGGSRPAWHSRVVMTGSSGGHAELWVFWGETRAALLEMIGPKESDLPAAAARAVAASAVLP